jgi:hypothetical protein
MECVGGSTPETCVTTRLTRESEEFIGTVDVWQLRRLRGPIMLVLMPGYIDHLELSRYLEELRASGR